MTKKELMRELLHFIDLSELLSTASCPDLPNEAKLYVISLTNIASRAHGSLQHPHIAELISALDQPTPKAKAKATPKPRKSSPRLQSVNLEIAKDSPKKKTRKKK